MCLPVSRLFWVSSLAYPNLLGTKGYVVVVVVVESENMWTTAPRLLASLLNKINNASDDPKRRHLFCNI
jgi:hypothetical protein